MEEEWVVSQATQVGVGLDKGSHWGVRKKQICYNGGSMACGRVLGLRTVGSLAAAKRFGSLQEARAVAGQWVEHAQRSDWLGHMWPARAVTVPQAEKEEEENEAEWSRHCNQTRTEKKENHED